MRKIWIRFTTLFIVGVIATCITFIGCSEQSTDTIPKPPQETPLPDDIPPQVPPQVPEEPKPQAQQKAQYVRAKTNGLNVRSGPSTSYSVVGQLEKGDMVTLIEKSGNWYKTRYKNKIAYLSANENHTEIKTMEKHADERIEKVIEEGLNLLGFPYVYGAIRLHDGKGVKLKGFDSGKYDCSSLTQTIYYNGASVLLDLTTRTQIKQGKHVEKNQLTRGDLMFFTNSQRYDKTGIERVGHVALYLGDNYILHTASDHAVVEEISSRRWSYYLETRRFI